MLKDANSIIDPSKRITAVLFDEKYHKESKGKLGLIYLVKSTKLQKSSLKEMQKLIKEGYYITFRCPIEKEETQLKLKLLEIYQERK